MSRSTCGIACDGIKQKRNRAIGMIRFLTTLLIVTIGIPSFGQDKPVPGYLMKQDFPDSVRALSLTARDGKRVAFGDVLDTYQGKKVVVDIWASWCRDCIVGLPKLEELKKKTDHNQVAYVFLSVDKDELKWKRAIERFGIPGTHYRIETGWDNPLSSYIVLDWIPRYLVLNEKSEVIMPKAISAGDQELQRSVLQKAAAP